MSGAWTWAVSHALFPLHERLKGHATATRRRELEESQWWSAGELQAYQLRRLQTFVSHLEQRVPYYRDTFARLGLRAADVRELADLARFPLLTKRDIRANSGRLKAEGAGRLKRYNTGGSSGEPLVFYMGKDRITHDVAAKWRATRWWGVDIGDREIVVWGSPVELGAQDHWRNLRDWLFRSELLPAFEMSAANLDRFVERIRAVRPTMLFGYPSSLALIAAHAQKRRVRLDDLGIRVAFVTSERLYDHQREAIGRVFGCRVANGYGGRDAGFIAHECPAGGMHISAEDILVEIVDAQGRPVEPDTAGEIVVTHLATPDFPFLRYCTGDIGVLGSTPCACGRSLPLLAAVQGRSTDFVVAADGTVMHGLALIYVVRDLPGIERFRIVQESEQRTRVILQPGEGFNADTVQTIRDGLRRRLGMGVQIDVEAVPELPPEPSGKFHYVTSRVAAARV